MSYLIKDIYHNLKIDPKNVKNTIWNDKNKRSKTLFWKSTKNKSRNANITEIYIKKFQKNYILLMKFLTALIYILEKYGILLQEEF